MASAPFYQAAKAALGKEAVASLFLDMKAARQNPKLQKALAARADLLQALLFADAKGALQNANWLAAGLFTQGDRLTVKLVTDSQVAADSPAGFARPSRPEEGTLPNLAVPRSIAGLSLYRDLHGFYAAKDTLFPERTSGLIFFENMMGIFFSGLDLTEGVLGETKPEIRFVASTQQYPPEGLPSVQIPAFAVVLPLRHPEKFGPVVEEAWQKAIGLVNFTRGQKALPGLIIDRLTYKDTKISYAYYRPQTEASDQPADIRYNFRPALACAGVYLVLSSTENLAKDLVDALAKETAAPGKALHTTQSLLEIDGANLREILQANREQMVRKNMVDKGHSREQANNELDLLFTVLDCIREARLSLGLEMNRPQAILDFKLNYPDAGRWKTAAAAGNRPAR